MQGTVAPDIHAARLALQAAEASPAAQAASLAQVERLLAQQPSHPTLQAYTAAIAGTAARFATNPIAQYRHCQAALATLDALVHTHNDLAELHFVRMLYCHKLPPMLLRQNTVRSEAAWWLAYLSSPSANPDTQLKTWALHTMLDSGLLSTRQRLLVQQWLGH